MSFFNRFRAFPEFEDMIDSLNLNRADEVGVIECENKAFDNCFKAFIDSQPSELQNGLSGIYQNGKNHVQLLQDTFLKLKPFVNDITQLKKLFMEKRGKEIEIEEIDKEVEKCKKEVEKAQQRLDGAKIKAKQPDIDKCEASLAAQNEKLSSAEQKSQTYHQEFVKYCEEYKTRFAEAISTMMIACCETKGKACTQSAALGNEIANSVLLLSEYSDATLPKLRLALEEFEQAVVE